MTGYLCDLFAHETSWEDDLAEHKSLCHPTSEASSETEADVENENPELKRKV